MMDRGGHPRPAQQASLADGHEQEEQPEDECDTANKNILLIEVRHFELKPECKR